MLTEIRDLDNITDEYILYKHNLIKSKIEYALNIVKEYIIKNKLLIVGGMAIDLALQTKKSRLYNPLYEIPDFDIISPNNIEHANNIGQILCNNKFENISIIPAIHHTTVRVQLLGYTIFDSTYVPEYIYNKIPNKEYKEYKFVDPNFQKINQYLSLSFLFKITGPSYNILNRFKKDIERFTLIDNYYNLIHNINFNTLHYKTNKEFIFNINSIKISKITTINTNNNINDITNLESKKIFKLINQDNTTYNIDSNIILHGVCAYNLIYTEFDNLYSKLLNIIKFKSDDLKIINDYYKFIIIKNKIELDKNNIKFKYNTLLELCFVNNNNSIDNFINILKNTFTINNIKKLDNILDLKPKYLECNANNEYNIKIYDLYGDLLGINLIYIKEINKLLPISTFTYNLMYFLTNYYLEDDDEIKKINLYYYISLKHMIKIIMFINENYNNELNKCYDFKNSCFNFSINTSGIHNYPDNYEYFIKNYQNLVEFNKNLNILPLKNYIGFPDCNIKNVFEITHSPYYNAYQQEINETNYFNIINQK
jgi:hypothetical protein